MSGAKLLGVFLRELVAMRPVARVPEPELVMDDPDQVAAYTAAGRGVPIMAPTHLFHTAQACQVIRPDDQVVLDLGCGPATQLAKIAGLNRKVQFIGVDLSEQMLDIARDYVRSQQVNNVSFCCQDITDLAEFADGGIDAVISSMSLHHLPDVPLLAKAFSQVARVLKPTGGIYIADFGRLRSATSMNLFAYDHADEQPESFTEDYINSLRAAFSVAEIKAVVDGALPGRAKVYRTPVAHFMVAVKSSARRPADPDLCSQLLRMRDELAHKQRVDLKDLTRFLRIGGLRCPFLD